MPALLSHEPVKAASSIRCTGMPALSTNVCRATSWKAGSGTHRVVAVRCGFKVGIAVGTGVTVNTGTGVATGIAVTANTEAGDSCGHRGHC